VTPGETPVGLFALRSDSAFFKIEGKGKPHWLFAQTSMERSNEERQSMSQNISEQQLHDRATRGEVLSAEERTRLQEWYTRLDREEGETLARAVPSASLATLQTQIETTLTHLATITQRIQILTSENAAIRQEITSLQALLAQKRTPQPT
jgi:hypothetical protein